MASSGSAGRSRVTEPTVRTKATIAAGEQRRPRTQPEQRADDPEDERLGEHERHHLAAASRRRRAAGRPRGSAPTTVIDSVLKMRNAPANRAIAAISAVVAWKSAVDARSAAARSCGEDSTYGSADRRASRAADDRGAVRARRRGRCRRGVTPSVANTAWAVRSGTMTVRPNGAGQRAVAGDDPDHAVGRSGRRRPGRSAASRARSPSWAASRSVMSALCSSGSGQRRPGDEGEVVEPAVGRRIDAEDRDRRRQGARRRRAPGRGRCVARGPGAATATPGVPAMAATRLGRQAGLAERRDPQVGAADEVADGAADRASTPAFVASPANRTRDAEGDPERAERDRARAGAQAAEGEPVQRHRAARRYSPSSASRAMSGVASWLSRRPSSIVSRIRPSPMTRTRSA